MAKSKLILANKKIARMVTDNFQKIEDCAVGTFQKIEDQFIDQYLTCGNESAEDAKERLRKEKWDKKQIKGGYKR
ncbi:hypothetical protein [Clostridium sp. AM58-1XD]|uniref:hypothetical protein n=1 Tax=Clostridium sp. AM58-1XD TaxID=2292307 RepID=UPI000E5453B8|nr:hypothetical protein [Clostridium sp. AM58-1XD]RGY99466.1 hypothetical protein DXA13_08165 [Clostridium sp. AM58-1XD]